MMRRTRIKHERDQYPENKAYTHGNCIVIFAQSIEAILLNLNPIEEDNDEKNYFYGTC